MKTLNSCWSSCSAKNMFFLMLTIFFQSDSLSVWMAILWNFYLKHDLQFLSSSGILEVFILPVSNELRDSSKRHLEKEDIWQAKALTLGTIWHFCWTQNLPVLSQNKIFTASLKHIFNQFSLAVALFSSSHNSPKIGGTYQNSIRCYFWLFISRRFLHVSKMNFRST